MRKLRVKKFTELGQNHLKEKAWNRNPKLCIWGVSKDNRTKFRRSEFVAGGNDN